MTTQTSHYVYVTFILKGKEYKCSVSSFEHRDGKLHLFLWQDETHPGNYGCVKGAKVMSASTCDWYGVSDEVASLLQYWND